MCSYNSLTGNKSLTFTAFQRSTHIVRKQILVSTRKARHFSKRGRNLLGSQDDVFVHTFTDREGITHNQKLHISRRQTPAIKKAYQCTELGSQHPDFLVCDRGSVLYHSEEQKSVVAAGFILRCSIPALYYIIVTLTCFPLPCERTW